MINKKDQIESTAIKQDLVLHICCAPDEAWVVHTLHDKYNLHCFFCNPNISPVTEYELRLKEASDVAKRYSVSFYSDTYEPNEWERAIKSYRNTPEGGERCRECIHLRLRRTARFCKENGFTSFTTVLSVSPHKKLTMLNETGNIAATEQGITYLPFDFKKQNGFLNSIKLSRELGLYRQDYCGCSLSKLESEIRRKNRNNTEQVNSPPYK